MEEIKISHIVKLLIDNKKRFIINGIIVFILSCAYILCIPRTYNSEIRLAPETEVSSSLSSLSSLASSFGLDIGTGQSSDAISPELYPDLFETNDFIVKLLGIKVYSEKANKEVDYFTYLTDYQDHTPWAPAVRSVKRLFKRKKKPIVLPGGMSNGQEEEAGINPFLLSEQEFMAVKAVKSNIKCSMDKKTGIISIMVKDQSPVICACLADSARCYLQDFITDYRTNKARVDVAYYQALCNQAKTDYETALARYSSFADAHTGNIRQSYQAKLDDMENDMQAKLTTYISMRQQLISSEAKVQERTPAFTVLQSASVPNKASGPKRMFFVAFMLMLSVVGTYIWLIRDDLKKRLGLTAQEQD